MILSVLMKLVEKPVRHYHRERSSEQEAGAADRTQEHRAGAGIS